MFFEIRRLRGFPMDDTSTTRAKWAGILSECIASKKLLVNMLEACPPDDDHLQALAELHAAIETLEHQLQVARRQVTK